MISQMNAEIQQNPENLQQKEEKKAELVKSVQEQQYTKAYNLPGDLIRVVGTKMMDSICFAERGIIKSILMNDQIYFSIDRFGNVQKVDFKNDCVMLRRLFELGNDHDGNCIAMNNLETCLLVGSYNNRNIYVVDPMELHQRIVYEKTHTSSLWTIIFLDSSNFCAGYADGLLKKFNLESLTETSCLKISKFDISSFCLKNNSTELFVGDLQGTLFSINWKIFTKTTWEAKIHNYQINSIAYSLKFFLTGSFDKSIALLDASAPPQILSRILIDSPVHQLVLTPADSNLIALCSDRLIFFKNDNGNLKKTIEKHKTIDFNSKAIILSSFALLDNQTVVVGDSDGYLKIMKLIEQAPDTGMQNVFYEQVFSSLKIN